MKKAIYQISKLAIPLVFVFFLLPSNTKAQCETTFKVIYPEWIIGTSGLSCASDPRGYDFLIGCPNSNLPASPPADGIWVISTHNGKCGKCITVTSYQIFKEDCTKIKNASGTEPNGFHEVDNKPHRI